MGDMELFHASGLLYDVGDIIQPGNWGRVVLGAGTAHPLYFRELLFEEVRLQLAPAKPSRLRSLFALQTQQELATYQQANQVRHGYRIEIPDDTATHLADLAIFDRLFIPNGHNHVKQALTDYWQGVEGASMELLAETPGEVVERF